MARSAAKGFSKIKLVLGIALALVVLALLGWAWAYERLPWSGIRVNKSDPKWLDTYCKAALEQLPPPPFAHQGRDGEISMLVIPMPYMYEVIGVDNVQRSRTCSVGYRFDTEEAYASLGFQWGADIKVVNKFLDEVERRNTFALLNPTKKLFGRITVKQKAKWQKLSPLGSEQSGQPGYVTENFPMVLKRENKKVGVTEYLNVFFGVDYYLNLTVFETQK